MNKQEKTMKYLVTSDIHLGHKNTPTTHICNTIRKQILSEQNKSIDILFISGDFFDSLLDANSKELLTIIELFNDLLTYCFINNILLRVLEGTPSHDRNQSEILVKLNDIRNNKCNLIYHKVLDIEYIKEHNKYVLYIPDEWVHDHTILEKQIQDKMLEYSISQVDIGIFHGQFAYQLVGKKYSGFHYKEEYFLPLIKGFIHVGHYHTYSTFDRIIANGSLERLAHGEEQPKGYLIVEDSNYTFIENPLAYTYLTLNVTAATTLDRLDKYINKLKPDSHIRLLLPRDHSFNITFQDLKLRYLDYNIKKLIKENISESSSVTYILTDSVLDTSNTYTLDVNIHDTLFNNLTTKNTLVESEVKKLLNYISIFKHKENLVEQDIS